MAKKPSTMESIKKLIESMSPMTPQATEKLVKEMSKVGDQGRRQAEKIVSEMMQAKNKSSQYFSAAVEREVAKQLGEVNTRLAMLEKNLEQLSGATPAKKAPVKKAAAKKAPAKKVAAKKSPAKKAPTR
jgi:polyhydroxyalkanoate synthesis regulator phasin